MGGDQKGLSIFLIFEYVKDNVYMTLDRSLVRKFGRKWLFFYFCKFPFQYFRLVIFNDISSDFFSKKRPFLAKKRPFYGFFIFNNFIYFYVFYFINTRLWMIMKVSSASHMSALYCRKVADTYYND